MSQTEANSVQWRKAVGEAGDRWPGALCMLWSRFSAMHVTAGYQSYEPNLLGKKYVDMFLSGST